VEDFFFTFIGQWSYFGLFGVLLAAGLGLPMPEDIPLLAAGWLCHKGQADLYWMIVTGLIGVMAGDSTLFFMGRRYGLHVVEHRWFQRIARPWMIRRARELYTNHGAKVLFVARFMPGLRAVMFLTAGTFRVPFWKFFSIDGLAALLSVPLWIVCGYKFAQHIEEFLGGARIATYVIVGLLVAALIAWGIWEYHHNLKKRNGRSATGEVRSAPLVPSSPGEPVVKEVEEAQPAGAGREVE